MIVAHVYLGEKMVTRQTMQHCPRVGDTLRYGAPDKYLIVTEVIWCLNEATDRESRPHPYDRVNLRTEEAA